MAEPAPPRYFQVKLALADLIAGLDRGTSLPPERQLAEQLGTSRTTLRKALAELAGEGVLRRTQGSGNFVAPPKVVHVRQLSSLTDDLKAEGMQPTSQILGLERVRALPAVAEHLEIAPGERIHLLTRLREVDGEPLAIEEAHLPGALPRLEARLAETGSLYAALRDCYDRAVHSVEDTVETALANPDQAELLQIATGQPLLLVHRTSRDKTGRIVEWTRSVYRGDRFRFVARA
ncbi:GntR family transcriptional regulator [Mycobacterium dioxanotrophicus]|uniref:GntR family transcriptional regulator n=1 Tax=Mycobacterium dioxanotrophicus TaxID=482462 RepID=A0A1Y0C9H4_9MYCO|nr:GntR family transcriptional regulator [Mycobacterium dioxanotrophicus]ART71706.1 GntR family transcriptional regulator [Mycobacterium dioxanotrophicus]